MRLQGAPPASAIRSPSSPRVTSPQQMSLVRHGSQASQARACTAGQGDLHRSAVTPCAVEGRHRLPEAVDRPTIVALGMVGVAKVEICQRCRTTSPLAVASARARWRGGDGLVMRAHDEEIVCQKDRDPSQPTRIIEGLGEGLGLAESRRGCAPKSAERPERRAQGEPEVDGLLDAWRVALADA